MNKIVTLDGLKEYNEYIPFKVNNGNITYMTMPLIESDVDAVVRTSNILLSPLKDGLSNETDTQNCIVIGENNKINIADVSGIQNVIIIGSKTAASNSNQVLLGNHNNATIDSSVVFSCGDGTGSAFAVYKGDFLNRSSGKGYYDPSGYSMSLGNQAMSIYANDNALVFQPVHTEFASKDYDYMPYASLEVIENTFHDSSTQGLNGNVSVFGNRKPSKTDTCFGLCSVAHLYNNERIHLWQGQFNKDNIDSIALAVLEGEEVTDLTLTNLSTINFNNYAGGTYKIKFFSFNLGNAKELDAVPWL